ncbi:sphingomyelin synthase-related protein 1-like isoform X2 [Pomacea canaliculata]|uniref:sphingomyelin synthase-related protein 1-like isoform X2 n=1 Tax=Pomacea canaliculata TaxID=400727 RepID=UPI000D73434F|nr:sphingomyelin synthase-related protein 1-like isoform X2 [Pomacea canaliculata]
MCTSDHMWADAKSQIVSKRCTSPLVDIGLQLNCKMAIHLSEWTCDDVEKWLVEQGFADYCDILCRQHKLDGQVLLMLTEDDLKQPPIKLTVLGDIKRIMNKINHLRASDPAYGPFFLNNGIGLSKMNMMANSQSALPTGYSSGDIDSSEKLILSNHELSYKSASRPYMRSSQERESKSLDPELWKTFLSFVYVFSVFLLTAFVMVIVHDRVPDMQKYPPLPDLFLDNMPYVPWAFEACELVGTTLAIIWFVVLIFHKHRFILLRRMFSLLGTIFLLRCVTMLITSMSVPGQHLQCVGKRYGDMWSRIQRTFDIWCRLGMSIQGVKSCGDYMFSGHTSIITILNFFITEYTPASEMYYLHMVSWVLNVFGIFFILAAHEHYSIDVFIAFYITSRLFMYYHTLANNRSLMQQDANRTRVWFPLFSFFESRCDGVVPNEYKWPFKMPKQIKELFKRNQTSTPNRKDD